MRSPGLATAPVCGLESVVAVLVMPRSAGAMKNVSASQSLLRLLPVVSSLTALVQAVFETAPLSPTCTTTVKSFDWSVMDTVKHKNAFVVPSPGVPNAAKEQLHCCFGKGCWLTLRSVVFVGMVSLTVTRKGFKECGFPAPSVIV